MITHCYPNVYVTKSFHDTCHYISALDTFILLSMPIPSQANHSCNHTLVSNSNPTQPNAKTHDLFASHARAPSLKHTR